MVFLKCLSLRVNNTPDVSGIRSRINKRQVFRVKGVEFVRGAPLSASLSTGMRV
jgi:hypothetical protein